MKITLFFIFFFIACTSLPPKPDRFSFEEMHTFPGALYRPSKQTFLATPGGVHRHWTKDSLRTDSAADPAPSSDTLQSKLCHKNPEKSLSYKVVFPYSDKPRQYEATLSRFIKELATLPKLQTNYDLTVPDPTLFFTIHPKDLKNIRAKSLEKKHDSPHFLYSNEKNEFYAFPLPLVPYKIPHKDTLLGIGKLRSQWTALDEGEVEQLSFLSTPIKFFRIGPLLNFREKNQSDEIISVFPMSLLYSGDLAKMMDQFVLMIPQKIQISYFGQSYGINPHTKEIEKKEMIRFQKKLWDHYLNHFQRIHKVSASTYLVSLELDLFCQYAVRHHN